MKNTRARQWYGSISIMTALVLILTGAGVTAQRSPSPLAERREDVMRKLRRPSAGALAEAEAKQVKFPGDDSLNRGPARQLRDVVSCPADTANPISSLVAREDNPVARALEGFVLRDKRGRHTRPWRALSRAEREKRGAVTHRPLLVFLETPATRQDFNKPWFGPVRFDRPGFPTTKAKITEQVFGKDFDHRDPASVAGFYLRESGGKLVIKGDASSVHTVIVPHMTFDPAPMVEAILAQLDPIVDFTQRADELGWVAPIFLMTPFSFVFDSYVPSVMGDGHTYLGYGPTVYDKEPAITNDAFKDGSHAALSALAISMVGLYFGENQDPWSSWFGLPEDQTRADSVELYAHEYGHAIGLSHMMSADYGLSTEPNPYDLIGRVTPPALNRGNFTGFVTTVMNYSYGSGGGVNLVPRGSKHAAGLDPMNRSKLGWGNVVEVTLSDDERRVGPHELAPGEQRNLEIVEHLGHGPQDPRPQTLKVNLPPQQISLFPHKDAVGKPTGYWRPGPETHRMVWSGRTFGGSRMMETSLRIPSDLADPVLSFWTKYGSHSHELHYPAGYDLSWVQVSKDGGHSWTSLSGRTSSTYVHPKRQVMNLVGDDLGAPAFTGDSRQFGPNGWILEQVPLPISPGASFLLRFNFGGYGAFDYPSQDYGWWIDDVHLGTRANPTRHLVSDFEGEDAQRWAGLLTEFDQGAGFVVVEETSPFPQTYFFELRGHNDHDEIAFQKQHPKVLNGYFDRAIYSYEDGVVGYFTNHYATFWAYPHFFSGSATHKPVPIERMKRADVCYPYCPGSAQPLYLDFREDLSAALNQNSGQNSALTPDDVVFFYTLPHELFFLSWFGLDDTYAIVGKFPLPSTVTLLDATPTYRPLDVSPSFPETPFPERFPFSPYIIGAPGGWPKTLVHGALGLNDPTTTRVVGQPFLGRDAAFHPNRNASFDDQVDYRGSFLNEFTSWHAQATQDAFASSTRSERIKLIPTDAIPVSETESIQRYELRYCPQNPSGACVSPAQSVQRPFVEQKVYERLAVMLLLMASRSCPPPPPWVLTVETKPLWDAYNACWAIATDNANAQANQLLNVARNLDDNPAYSWLSSYGNQGTLSHALWTEFYLDGWARAKGPAPLPSFGFSMEVERITKGGTPTATLKLRRSRRK